LSVPQEELIDSGLIINVHKSVAEANVYVACGEVLSAPAPEPTTPPAATATAGTGVMAPNTGTGHAVDDGYGSTPAIAIALLSAGLVVTLGAIAVRTQARKH
jgi:hypothetical protein